MRQFRLPDAYLPDGFRRDPKNRHWVEKRVDPACNESYCNRYALLPGGYCSTREISARPGDANAPMGIGGTFTARTIGGTAGYWNIVYESATTAAKPLHVQDRVLRDGHLHGRR